jgi:hypothetical protein
MSQIQCNQLPKSVPEKNEPFSPLALWRFLYDLPNLSQMGDTFGHTNSVKEKMAISLSVSNKIPWHTRQFTLHLQFLLAGSPKGDPFVRRVWLSKIGKETLNDREKA